MIKTTNIIHTLGETAVALLIVGASFWAFWGYFLLTGRVVRFG